MDRLKAWWNKPYDEDMGVMGWFLFFGLLTIIAFLWSRILHEIAE